MRIMKRWGAIAATVVTMAAGCSSGSGTTSVPDTGTPVCTPGATQACVCAGSKSGAQQCASDGSAFLACDCGTTTPPCSASNPSGSCPTGQTCVAGSCCASAQMCGANCCAAGSTCIKDGTGTLTCMQVCTASSQCPNAKGCCTLLDDGTGVCAPVGAYTGQLCMCAQATDCTSGVCGEAVDGAGNPRGRWVCQANDGLPYHGCNSGVSCSQGCCVTLTDKGGAICEAPCQNNSQCGAATCSMLTNGTCNGSPGRCQ